VEIMLNADGTLWIERLSAGMECIGTMLPSQAESVICSVAAYHKEIVTRENPIFEGELPLNGERFEALIPPVVSAPVFTIRLKASKIFTLAEYVSASIMTEHQREMIESAVLNRQNILVVGGTGTGKTTLTNAIIEAIERLAPDHRLIIIEDTAEIQCSAKNVNLLHATDTVDMLRLLKATMRLRPDRILVGEVRGPEALALLKAWNTGHPGGAATVHANSARAGLIRLEQLIAETSANPMQRLIAEAVNVIVSIIKTPEGRKIDEILTVRGFQDGDYVLI
jgi:type IV secretion system protein TrbB